MVHQYLYNDLGILHRDISLKNILLRRVGGSDEAVGLLIDFYYAKMLLLEGLPASASDFDGVVSGSESLDDQYQPYDRTFCTVSYILFYWFVMISLCNHGTPSFMSIEALTTEDKNFAHHPCCDLESILYIVFYIWTFIKEPRIPCITEVNDKLPLCKLFSHEEPKEIKLAHISTPDIMIINHFTNYWADFALFVPELASVCFWHVIKWRKYMYVMSGQLLGKLQPLWFLVFFAHWFFVLILVIVCYIYAFVWI